MNTNTTLFFKFKKSKQSVKLKLLKLKLKFFLSQFIVFHLNVSVCHVSFSITLPFYILKSLVNENLAQKGLPR